MVASRVHVRSSPTFWNLVASGVNPLLYGDQVQYIIHSNANNGNMTVGASPPLGSLSHRRHAPLVLLQELPLC